MEDWFIEDDLEILCANFRLAFANTFAGLLEAKNISGKDLAKKASIHPTGISHYLAARRLPSASILYVLAKSLELEDKERSRLIVSWHLSLVVDSLYEYVRCALENNDRASARAVFVDMLEGNWGDVLLSRVVKDYLSLIHEIAPQESQRAKQLDLATEK